LLSDEVFSLATTATTTLLLYHYYQHITTTTLTNTSTSLLLALLILFNWQTSPSYPTEKPLGIAADEFLQDR